MRSNIRRSVLPGLGEYLVGAGKFRANRLVLPLFVLALLTLLPLVAQAGTIPLALLAQAGNFPPALLTQADTKWKTTRFKVFAGNPYIGSIANANSDPRSTGFNGLEFEDVFDSLDDDAKAEIELAFTEAAQWYKDMGLPAPLLYPLKKDEEGFYYQIYVCKRSSASDYSDCGDEPDPDDSSSGSYIPRCGNDPTRFSLIALNSLKILDGDELNEVGYQTVAHELMHGIISNTNLGRAHQTCTVQYWITESLPDAISLDLIEEKGWKSRYFSNNDDDSLSKKYGIRPYFLSLATSSKPFKYITSSFWRFVADLNNGWKGLLVDPEETGLLDFEIPGKEPDDYFSTDWRSEVVWLNSGLDRKFSRDLSEVYGLFVNNFIFRLPPVKDYRGNPPEEVLPRWARALYNECTKVDLSGTTSQVITLVMKRLAARCIVIEPTAVSGLIQISFQASSTDESLLKDIRIGQAGTALDVRAKRASTSANSASFLGGWLGFQQDGQTRTYYVVSNVAADPKLTLSRDMTITVARPNSDITTVPLPPAPVAARPLQPSFKKHARSLVQQQRATTKMIQEQMTLDKTSLNPNVDSAAKISRRTNNPDCPEPFKYSVCGPYLGISLSLVPGTFITPGQANTQGGTAGQIFAGFQAMAATSLDVGDSFQELGDRLDSIDGNRVSIAIPLIDYGDSGSFSNASISVGMSGGKTLHAIGPPDENQRTELRGSVTIDEYTPFIIRGTFRAPLAEFDESGAYVSRETVSGSFTSVAPWQSDSRVTLLLDSTEEMADDIADAMGLPAGMINAMKADGSMPGSSSTGPTTGPSSSNRVVDCTCECKIKPFADELCEMLCEEEFAACESP